MTTQGAQNTRHRVFDSAQRAKDVLLVSSFGLWVTVIGLSPVLVFRLLTAA